MVRKFAESLAKNVQKGGSTVRDFANNKFTNVPKGSSPESSRTNGCAATGESDAMEDSNGDTPLVEAIRAKAMEVIKARAKATDLDEEPEGVTEDSAGAGEVELRNKRRKLKEERIAVECEYGQEQENTLELCRALYHQRERSNDLIRFVEYLVNTISNSPKEFRRSFEEIEVHRQQFVGLDQIDQKNLQDLRVAGGAVVAGVGAAAAVATLAPTAAMWAATTFGVASTGTAISTLSGAAATSASLAWLGGGALATGGAGAAGGAALLALAGPVGWSIAGATVLGTAVGLTMKRRDTAKLMSEQIATMKQLVHHMRTTNEEIGNLIRESDSLRSSLESLYLDATGFSGADFSALQHDDRQRLTILVNSALCSAEHLSKTVSAELPRVPVEESSGASGAVEEGAVGDLEADSHNSSSSEI